MTGGIALVLVWRLASGGGLGPAPSGRAEDERAVERARYRFVIGATKPFDEVYPRSVFEKRVAREAAQERVLKRVFGVSVEAV